MNTKHIFLSFTLCVSAVVFSGCTVQTTSTTTNVNLNINASALGPSGEEFTPPSAVVRGMGDAGPYEMRLLSAHSSDGVHWTRDEKIISEQANVPDMYVDTDGVIHLYYMGGNILGKDQAIASAISDDNGATWTYRLVDLGINYDDFSTPGDPDVVVRPDGTIRLYFTAQKRGDANSSIHYSDSTDGTTFTYGGVAFAPSVGRVEDSTTVYINGHWVMHTLHGFGTTMYKAVSDDGDTFTYVKDEEFKIGQVPYFFSNPFTLPDGSVRFFAFQLRPSEFRSFTSSDGDTWTPETTTYLSFDGSSDLEGYYIKDPVVTQLKDGSYFMVYVTRAPQ